ncbi:Uncharacterised protein [Sphingobacterium multivorum]|nr:Uncharacterised protein [Sphingobacterium multivorum]
MDKLFRQVSTKDRLPKQDGNYWCKMSYIDSALYQQNFKAEFGGFGDNSVYEYWLEEVELNTKEAIEIIGE